VSGLVSALLALSTALAACTAPAPATPPQATTSAATQSGSTSAGQPARAGAPSNATTLVLAASAGVSTLDPAIESGASFETFLQMWDALTKFDAYTMKLGPGLATSWKPLDANTWQFKLRENVKFHNGEPFDARAVKYTFERIADPANKSEHLSRAPTIKRVDIVDPHTVNIVTSELDATLPLGVSWWLVMPPQYIQDKGLEYALAHPVGTGPFKFVDWRQGDFITMDANPEYWGGKPNFERLTIKVIPEPATRLAALKAGEAQIAVQLPPDLVSEVTASSDLRVETVPVGVTTLIQFDTAHGPADSPLKNQKVRQALNYAVDKQSLHKNLLAGQGAIAQGQSVSPEAFGYNPNIKAYPYDLDKAKQLLSEAGYPNGFSFTMYTPVGKYLMDKEVTTAIADQLSKIGVQAKVQALEWGVFSQQIRGNMNGEAFMIGWYDYGDADFSMRHATTNSPYRFMSAPEYDELMRQSRSAAETEQRQQLLWKAGQVLHDTAPGIWLFHLPAIHGVSNRVDNYKPRPDEKWNFLPLRLKP
jgi:peptide/nickel transport system substrate-binding protein